jgi:uncharacterized protein YceK
MRVVIALIGIVLSGCATVHDYCVEHEEHYRSYNECYVETSAMRAKSTLIS